MRWVRGFCSLVLLLGVSVAGANGESVAGSWEGTLEPSAALKLRVVMHLEKGETGWSAEMDSPDQGVQGIPASEVLIDGSSVRIEIAPAGAVFEGVLAEDGSAIEGAWKQGGLELPLRLTRASGEEPEAPKRPQSPPSDVSYRREEVRFTGGAEDVTLAGTLSVPEGEGPFPAVLLITGSGAQDRDETAFGHKPFAVIAHHLTERGVAVLRVDDRGFAESTGDITTATTEDFAADALAGFRYLRAREETDPEQVGLLGHSEGGIVAPMVAAQEDGVAFLVLLAAPGVPGEQILYRQAEAVARAAGAAEEAVKEQRTLQERMYRAVIEAQNEDEAAARLAAIGEELAAETPEAGRDQVRAQYGTQTAPLSTPWFRTFLTLDPAPYLARVSCPVLALWGEKDIQVPPDQSMPPMEAAMAGKGLLTAEVVAGANHLFQDAETGHVIEYTQIEETMSPAVLETISGWIAGLAAAETD